MPAEGERPSAGSPDSKSADAAAREPAREHPADTAGRAVVIRRSGSPALRAALTILAVLTVAVLATGMFSAPWPWDARIRLNAVIALQHAVMFAYLVGAYLWVEARAAGVLRAIADGNTTPRLPHTGIRAAVLIGLGAGALGPWLAAPWQAGILDWWRIGEWTPLVAWHRVLSLLIGVALALFANAVIQVSRRLSQLARSDVAIDGFDVDRQRPFIEQGLTHGAMVAGLLCLISLLVFDHGANPMLVAVASAGAVLTVLAVMMPLRGVRYRIRLAKMQLLVACDTQIKAFADELRNQRPGPPAGRLSDLVAFRSQVERIREWPFDTSAIRRVVVYLLLPLLTWLLTVALQPRVESWLATH